MRSGTLAHVACAVALAGVVSHDARAEQPAGAGADTVTGAGAGRAVGAPAPDVSSSETPPSDASPGADDERRLAALASPHFYARFLATGALGDGLRFNNPYRLSHELGKTGESLSSTAPYYDLGIGMLFGPPDGIQHGAFLSWSSALSGVPQNVVTPSYLALYRGPHRWLAFARAGIPIVLGPDRNAGLELAVGGAWFVTASIGVTASMVADGFYGAGTSETPAAFYPVLSAQAGLVVDYEVLP